MVPRVPPNFFFACKCSLLLFNYLYIFYGPIEYQTNTDDRCNYQHTYNYKYDIWVSIRLHMARDYAIILPSDNPSWVISYQRSLWKLHLKIFCVLIPLNLFFFRRVFVFFAVNFFTRDHSSWSDWSWHISFSWSFRHRSDMIWTTEFVVYLQLNIKLVILLKLMGCVMDDGLDFFLCHFR